MSEIAGEINSEMIKEVKSNRAWRLECEQLRAENERLKDVIAKCAEALDEALFTKHNEMSFVFCILKLEHALAAIKEMRNEP